MRMKSARVHRPLLPFPLPPPPPITPAFASSGIPKQQPSTTISAASSAQSGSSAPCSPTQATHSSAQHAISSVSVISLDYLHRLSRHRNRTTICQDRLGTNTQRQHTGTTPLSRSICGSRCGLCRPCSVGAASQAGVPATVIVLPRGMQCASTCSGQCIRSYVPLKFKLGGRPILGAHLNVETALHKLNKLNGGGTRRCQ